MYILLILLCVFVGVFVIAVFRGIAEDNHYHMYGYRASDINYFKIASFAAFALLLILIATQQHKPN